jgi:hypothetical protein
MPGCSWDECMAILLLQIRGGRGGGPALSICADVEIPTKRLALPTPLLFRSLPGRNFS